MLDSIFVSVCETHSWRNHHTTRFTPVTVNDFDFIHSLTMTEGRGDVVDGKRGWKNGYVQAPFHVLGFGISAPPLRVRVQ